jgi:hypothetical protein
MEILSRTMVGREFAMKAVQVLSHYPDWVDDMNPRMALAGLIIMVCETARMNPINNFARWWSNNSMESTMGHLMRDYVLKYGRMSHELLTWKSKGYTNPNPYSQVHDIYLVLNYRLDHPPHHASFMDRGRPRVELLAMRADLGVVGTTIMVFDGKRGHIIYTEEQEEHVYTSCLMSGINPKHYRIFLEVLKTVLYAVFFGQSPLLKIL